MSTPTEVAYVRRSHVRRWRTGVRVLTAVAASSVAISVPVAAGATGAPTSALPHFSQPVAEAIVAGTVFVVNQGDGGYLSKLTISQSAQATYAGLLQSSSYELSWPDAITSDGGNLFVVSRGGAGGGAAVTEIAARTGDVVRVIRGASYRFSSPDAIVADGLNLLVVNGGGSVTEFTTSGTLIRVMTGAQYKFHDPVAAVLAKGGLWVVNSNGSSLTEVNPANGKFVKNVPATQTNGLSTPDGIAFDGTNLWVANWAAPYSLSEFNAVTGGFVANRGNSYGYGLTNPGPMTATATYVYVMSPPGSSPMVTGVRPGSGDLLFWMCNANSAAFQFTNPQAIVAGDGYLFVANEGSSTVTQMHAISGMPVGTGPIT